MGLDWFLSQAMQSTRERDTQNCGKFCIEINVQNLKLFDFANLTFIEINTENTLRW